MADDKTNRGAQDRAKAAAGQDYEVRYLAEKHGLSPDQARDLIKKHGNDRATLDAAARRLK